MQPEYRTQDHPNKDEDQKCDGVEDNYAVTCNVILLYSDWSCYNRNHHDGHDKEAVLDAHYYAAKKIML